jgi:parallel beta-helix repeat protein
MRPFNIVFVLLLVSILAVTLLVTYRIPFVKAEWIGTVYIRADGSVDPVTAPISNVTNVKYIFTGNITGSVVIERGSIDVDGAWFTLQGTGTGISISGSASNVAITNLIVKGFEIGIDLSSHNNRIHKNTITGNTYGIYVKGYPGNNEVDENTLTKNTYGVYMYHSSSNRIWGNSLIQNTHGITLVGSPHYPEYNRVHGNTLVSNGEGIWLYWASSDVICHNNFIGNINNVHQENQENIAFDDGYPSGGNYWDDYEGVDTDKDGIGDYPYALDIGQDRYPLIAPFQMFCYTTYSAMDYYVEVVSNSTIFSFHFDPDEGAFLKFNVTGEGGTEGFCRVTIPKDLLWATDGWNVSVGEQKNVSYTLLPHVTNTYLCFMYSHSTSSVIIEGTGVIPEFPSFLILPLFTIATLLALIVYKRKHPR